jgi:CubicO group peptidase (beta-lactamase class C family)
MNVWRVPGVSVTYFEDENIRCSKSFGTLERDTGKSVTGDSIFHACSMSKMITAVCVLKLIETGALDVYVDVNQYLLTWKIPESDFTGEQKINLAHLLSHTAGFRDIDGSFEPYIKGDVIPSNLDLLTGATPYNSEAVCPKYTPETDFAYSDAGYCVIEQILQDTTGKNICQLAVELVFKPLGLKNTLFWQIGEEEKLFSMYHEEKLAVGHDNGGKIVEQIRARYPNIGGAALWSTSDELSIIAIDIIKSYKDGSGILLSAETANLMLTLGLGVFLANDNSHPFFFSQGWGVGMQCKLLAYYKEERGVTVMTNSDPGIEQDKALVGEIITAICKGETI